MRTSTTLAVCLCGAPRSMDHPIVIKAFRTAFSVLRTEGRLSVFAVLSADDDDDDLEEAKKRHAKALDLYGVHSDQISVVGKKFSNTFIDVFWGNNISCAENSPCREKMIVGPHGHRLALGKRGKLCDNRDQMESNSHKPETGEAWAEQIWKATICWRMVVQKEKQNNRKFDFILKWRPDVLFLSPFPPLPSRESYVYVDRRTQDHYFLCPRYLCLAFFEEANQRQMNCTAGPSFGFGGGHKIANTAGIDASIIHFQLPLEYARFHLGENVAQPFDCIIHRTGGNDNTKRIGSEVCLTHRCHAIARIASALNETTLQKLDDEVKKVVEMPVSMEEMKKRQKPPPCALQSKMINRV